MPRKMHFSQLPPEVQRLDPAIRAELLKEEGIELQVGPEAPPARDLNPFRQRMAQAFEQFGGEVPLLTQDQAKGFERTAGRAAMGAIPAAIGGGGAIPIMVAGALNAALGPEANSGSGMANAAFDIAASAANPLLGKIAGPARQALARATSAAVQTGGAQAVGSQIDEGSADLSPGMMGLSALMATLPSGVAGYLNAAVRNAKSKVDLDEIKNVAMRMLRGAQLEPAELKSAQNRLTAALGQEGQIQQKVSEITDQYTAARSKFDATMQARERSAERVPVWMRQQEPSGNPFTPPKAEPVAGPKVLPGTTRRTAERPYDSLLEQVLNDSDPQMRMMEMQASLAQQGVPKEQINQIASRLRELQTIRDSAERIRKTTETGQYYTRVDDPFYPRPSRAKDAPKPERPIAALPQREIPTPVTPTPAPPDARIIDALQGMEEQIRKVDPASLSKLDESVKTTLGEMRTKAGNGGVGDVITKALDDPAEFSQLPRYIDALETAFPNMNARKTVQAQIVSGMLDGFGDEAQPTLGVIQRIRGFGEDRAKVINKVFDSPDAYRNLETLHDSIEVSQQPDKGKLASALKIFTNAGNNMVAGIPVGGITFYLSSAMIGGGAPAAVAGGLGVAAALGGGKLITVTLDKLADMIASNRTKTWDVIYDLARGGGKYSPQTVNQVIAGLRRRATEERDVDPERDAFLRSLPE